MRSNIWFGTRNYDFGKKEINVVNTGMDFAYISYHV